MVLSMQGTDFESGVDEWMKLERIGLNGEFGLCSLGNYHQCLRARSRITVISPIPSGAGRMHNA